MRTPVLLALWLTGCFSDRGLAIEIDVGSTGATSVELFVGLECDEAASECRAITVPGSDCAFDGARYYRDANLSYTVAVRGHVATFKLAAQTESAFPIAVAVGLDASGKAVGTATLLDLTISPSAAQIATATLVNAVAIPPATDDAIPAPTGVRVMVWSDPRSSRCLAVEHWKAGSPVQRIGIGPIEDPQCRSGAATTDAAPVCVSDLSPRDCYLGVPVCREPGATPPALRCPTNGTVCAPRALCGKTGLDEIIGALKPDASVTRLECIVVTRADGEACPDEAMVNVGGGAVSCDERPRILALDQFDAALSRAELAGVTVEVANASGACELRLKIKGGNLVGTPDVWGAVRLSSQHDFLVPLLLRFRRGLLVCPAQSITCEPFVAPEESLFTCATSQ
jgi:hypothetical protein